MEKETPLLTAKEQHIIDAQKEIEWLQTQVASHEKRLQSSADTASRTSQIEENLHRCQERIAASRALVLALSRLRFGKEAVVQSLDSSFFSRKALYPTTENEAESVPIQEALEKRDRLVGVVMKTLKELQWVKKEMATVQQQIVALHGENKASRLSLQATQTPLRRATDLSSQYSLDSQPRVDGLGDMKNQLEVIRHVLLKMILESDIDWTSHARWLESVLRIGTEMD
ncbi:hypothetical protein BDF14DRAFT_1882915 [Spinellus fusiger]|nr:hypothetical protein BDF14DRAFT_1882915 [Spinellus fusiger]